ncbi:MAG: hypothetical protein JKY95_07780 [Planctomycetaceae bacterium]|nr:hypothetical protein [Planctomycetaceae bacterium]
MAVSNLVRNLRDAELVLKDGTAVTPLSLTVLLDEGDLSWTEKVNTIEIKDRGSLSGGHLRKGDEESVTLSFSAKWTQLIGKAANAGDPLQLYEFLTFASGAGITSTSADGEQETLTLEFTVLDPAGVASEIVTFDKVYRESLSMSEGDDYNMITFSGRAFVTSPTVARV